MVKIQLKSNVVDFEMGEVNVSATYNLETLKLVIANKKETQEELKQVQIALSDTENLTEDTITNAIDRYLTASEKAFSSVFGEGSFTAVYESCHDIVATAEAFEEALNYLNNRMEKEMEQNKKEKQKKLAKYKK